MRWALFAAVLAAGCGKKEEGGSGGGVADASGPPVAYAGEYTSGNPIAADAKYKGKRVTFTSVEIDKISRTKDGRAYVAPLSVLLMGPAMPAGTGGLGGHAPVQPPEPCYYFFLRSDADAAGVSIGESYEITGTCRGFQKDDLWRGNVAGMDWHVDFENCTIRAAKK